MMLTVGTVERVARRPFQQERRRGHGPSPRHIRRRLVRQYQQPHADVQVRGGSHLQVSEP